MAETLLALRDVAVHHGDHVALQDASLEVYTGDVVALIGPNGAGKSTLLRVMGMLQLPGQGTVRFRGENALDGNQLALRRRIATVFQEPLLLNASVYQNAALGLKLRGVGRDEMERRLAPWLRAIGHRASAGALRAHAFRRRGAAHEPGAGAGARTGAFAARRAVLGIGSREPRSPGARFSTDR